MGLCVSMILEIRNSHILSLSIGQNNEAGDEIDLNDPEVNKAAVKIQASFRGHLTRKKLEH